MTKYEVYRANENDKTYTQNFYNFEDFSLNLLKSQKPLRTEGELDQNEVMGNMKTFLEKRVRKNLADNQRGTCKIDKNVPQLSESLFKAKQNDVNVEVLNSQHKSDLYHFKVMQLRNYEDTETRGECKVRFHFYFELLRREK